MHQTIRFEHRFDVVFLGDLVKLVKLMHSIVSCLLWQSVRESSSGMCLIEYYHWVPRFWEDVVNMWWGDCICRQEAPLANPAAEHANLAILVAERCLAVLDLWIQSRLEAKCDSCDLKAESAIVPRLRLPC